MAAIITTRYEQLRRIAETRDSTLNHLSNSQGARAGTPGPPRLALSVGDGRGIGRRMRRFGEPFNAGNSGVEAP